jgi:MGT family glycosyltransferase
MSTIVFLGLPAHGHVNPTLPVVQELLRRGERVRYYNTEEFRPQIEAAGATFRPYPAGALSSAAIAAALHDGALARVTALLLKATEALLPALLDELRRERPDLIVFDSTALWGRMAATLLGVRAAGSITTFVFDLKTGGVTLRDVLALLRQALPVVPGLLRARRRLVRSYGAAYPTGQPLFPMRGGMNLVFTARELQPPSSLIDGTFRFVGPSLDPQTRGAEAPFATPAAGPLVYISLGTVHSAHAAQGEFYRRCFAAFGDYPAQFVLAAGRQSDIAALGPIPENFTVRPAVPQLQVLERADLFITHGGINSMHEGLYYGVPLILIPQQFEQLLNARIAAAQGAGLILDGPLRGRALTPADLRAALERVMAEAGFRAAAQRVQGMLRATGGYSAAADELQAYLAAREGAPA